MDKEKILFIYNNINNVNNHNDIIRYIKYKNIKYTLNNNGFFVNISCLSQENIDNIYNIINYSINNIIDDSNYIDLRNKLISDNFINNKKIKKDINNILLSEFTDIQQEIIKHSKQFKLNLT
tara:strand:+ start:200 stop:565 length:366 start_codon:yes stop_codon:yes gene_type:complete